MTVRRLIALAASLLVLAAPSAALAQGAGDDQYSDPFGSNQSGDSGSGGGGGGDSAQPTPTPAATSAPTAPSTPSTSSGTAPSAATASATPAPAGSEAAAPVTTSQGQLPYTGADAGLIALAGALCIGGGVALRVRLREQ